MWEGVAPVLLPGFGAPIPSLPERASGALHLPWDCDTSRLEGEMLVTPWKILGSWIPGADRENPDGF